MGRTNVKVRIIAIILCCVQLCVARGPHKGTQTEPSPFGSSCTSNGTSSVQPDGILPPCSCDARMVFNDLKDQLQQEHVTDKEGALKSLEERVRVLLLMITPASGSHIWW